MYIQPKQINNETKKEVTYQLYVNKEDFKWMRSIHLKEFKLIFYIFRVFFSASSFPLIMSVYSHYFGVVSFFLNIPSSNLYVVFRSGDDGGTVFSTSLQFA